MDDTAAPAETLAIVDELLNHAPCGFFSFGDDGTLELANATLLDMLGVKADEVVGQHVGRILTVGSRIFYQTHWFPLLRLHGSAEEIFLMLRSGAGEEIGVLANARRREHDGGVSYDCIVMRVRERQKFEEELLRARRTAEAARAEMQAQTEALQAANEELEMQAVEMELQQQQLEEQTAALEIATEELKVINETLRARTEEAEQLRTIAEEANQAKSTFLAVMSHELRTPLNAIAGYVQLMELGIHGPVTEAQLDTLSRIDRSERHLLRLINEILNLARIEAGRVEYAIEEVPVEEIVGAVTPMVEPQLASKKVAFEVDVAPGLRVRADREKVQQVVLNLLGNAVKFTPSGGRVRLEAVASPGTPPQLLLRVRDTGIGIPPGKLSSVFEPFVQVDASRTRNDEGSGLGLAISRDLARGMDGDITAESTLGKGSTFTLALPLAAPSTGTPHAPAP